MRAWIFAALVLALIASPAAPPAMAQGQARNEVLEPMPVAVLETLDKITARVARVEAVVGGAPVSFGSLRIYALACREAPPEYPPESAVFLYIADTVDENAAEPKVIFSGWMFASSPAVSALEHPVYDVWALDCRNESSSAESSPQ